MPHSFLPPVIAALLLLPLAACDRAPQEPPPPRTFPAGTVLVLNETPITADEVDAVGSIIARTEPKGALIYFRRVALTNVLFQRIAGMQIAGARRAEAQALAQVCKKEIDSGSEIEGPRVGVLRQERDGYFKAIGLEAWNYGIDAEIGRWSEPIETVGAFEIVRVNSRSKAGAPRDIVMNATVVVVPYIDAADPRSGVEAHLDRSKLEFVDDSWHDVVPTYWKNRLRGGSP